MLIRYTAPYDLEIAASQHELHRVALALSKARTGVFMAEICEPAPYAQALTELEIITGSGPVEVSVRGSSVIVTGSPERLEAFGSFFAAAAEGGHAHFEWFDGNAFVAQTSVPLVITCSDATAG